MEGAEEEDDDLTTAVDLAAQLEIQKRHIARMLGCSSVVSDLTDSDVGIVFSNKSCEKTIPTSRVVAVMENTRVVEITLPMEMPCTTGPSLLGFTNTFVRIMEMIGSLQK